MSMSRVPPELSDYIIDFLHDSTLALKSCSLTRKSWLPASQYHLFRRVALQLPDLCKSFTRLLRGSSYIGSLVSEFGISSVGMKPSTAEGDKLAQDQSEMLPSSIFPLLTHVRRFEIFVLTVNSLLKTNLVQNFTMLQQLTLQYCQFPTFGDFVELFHSFPVLETLIVRGVDWDATDYVAPTRPDRAPKLKKLTMGKDLDVATIIEWIVAEDIHHELESFSACCSSEKDAITFGGLIQALGPSLRTFEFDLYSSKPADVLSLPHDFILNQCSSLSSLTLHCPILSHQSLPWVTSLLSRTSAASIEVVNLEIRLLGELDAIDWGRMDEVLSKRSLMHLKKVVFKVHVWPTASLWSKDVQVAVRTRLPNLDSKGMVHFAS